MGLTIRYCKGSKCNGLFFKILTPRILEFFFNVFDIVIIKVFQPNGNCPLGFENKLRENVFWPWISFQLLLSLILAVLMQLLEVF